MKPKSIHFDGSFEKHWNKYLEGLTEKQKERMRKRLAIFKEDIFDKKRVLSLPCEIPPTGSAERISLGPQNESFSSDSEVNSKAS